MNIQRLTPQDESRLPIFGSHQEASDYFNQQYGDQFVIKHVTDNGGTSIFQYVLILDPVVYQEGQAKLKRFEMINGEEFRKSFQTIQITDEGEVEIGM